MQREYSQRDCIIRDSPRAHSQKAASLPLSYKAVMSE